MSWAIGICQLCFYSRPDQYGGTCYCVFKVRHRSFSLFRMKFVRRWVWVCDDCESQTTKQARRNRRKP